MALHSIFFDLGNVIIDLKPEGLWWEEDVLPYFDAGEIARLVEQGFFEEYETGRIDDDTFRLELHLTRKYDSSPEVVDNCWNALLQGIPEERLDILSALSYRYNIYLLSNTNNIHLQHIIRYCEQEYGYNIFERNFRKCFFSHEMGCRKPEEQIYLTAWSEAGTPFEGSLYLDDKLNNLEAPARLGAETLLVDNIQDTWEKLSRLIT